MYRRKLSSRKSKRIWNKSINRRKLINKIAPNMRGGERM